MSRNYNSNSLHKRAYSKEPIRDFNHTKWSATVTPNFSFDQLISMIDSEPVASGAIYHFVDKCMEGDWAVIKRGSRKYDKDFEEHLAYDFDFEESVLRKVFLHGRLFRNAFLEVVKNPEGGFKAFNVLDATNIEVITKPNGDVLEFKSKTAHPDTGEFPTWDKDSVLWFKFTDRNGGYAPVDIKALWNTLLQKHYIQRFVTWLWQTGQYRVVHNFKSSNNQVVKNFIAYNRKNESDFRQPFLAEGEYVINQLRDMRETESLVELLKYLDSQILILLRTPPIDVGIPDASGRSNADAQSNSFTTTVKSFKKVVSNGINRLFRKINKGNNLFVFMPVDKFEEKSILEAIQIMKSAGFSNDVAIEYMKDKGLYFDTANVFVEPEDSFSVDNPRDKDNMPSRVGKGVGESNNKIGSGDESSTRDEQLIKRSRWTYDVVVD